MVVTLDCQAGAVQVMVADGVPLSQAVAALDEALTRLHEQVIEADEVYAANHGDDGDD